MSHVKIGEFTTPFGTKYKGVKITFGADNKKIIRTTAYDDIIGKKTKIVCSGKFPNFHCRTIRID